MNNDPFPNQTLVTIRKHLKTLKLKHMKDNLEDELTKAAKENLPPIIVLERLLAVQAQVTIQNRIERRIRESKLPQRKLLADFDFEFQKGLDKTQIMDLAGLALVERKQGLILAGSSGTGKSHIAKALLLIGCQKLYRCLYTTAADTLKDLLAGLSDDTLEQKLKNTPDHKSCSSMKSVSTASNRNPHETPLSFLRLLTAVTVKIQRF